LKQKYFGVPWKKIAGMRDKLIHEYFGIDLEIIWKTVHEDLPQIEPPLKQILNDLQNE